MAKAPIRGHTKTRLAAAIGDAAAVALAERFLLDTIGVARQVPDVDLSLFCPSAEHQRALAAGLPPDVLADLPIRAQTQPGLMPGLAEAMRTHFALGYERVGMIDADSPIVPAREFARAFQLLDDADVVLGPCDDGGYFLVASRADYPWLFLDEPREAAQVCAQTAASVRRRGLRVELLAPSYDVDVLADLERLRADLAANPRGAPWTSELLATLFPADGAMAGVRSRRNPVA